MSWFGRRPVHPDVATFGRDGARHAIDWRRVLYVLEAQNGNGCVVFDTERGERAFSVRYWQQLNAPFPEVVDAWTRWLQRNRGGA